MKFTKMRLLLTISIMAIVLSACFETPPCDVSYYYMSPHQMILIKNIPDTSYFDNIFLLTSVKSDTLITRDSIYSNDTLIINKKMIINNSCNLLINSENYHLYEGDTLFYGNKLIGGTYSRIKFSCDYINIPQESINLTIWIKRFIQDCNNWN